MSKAASHAMADTTTSDMGETHVAIATHAMAEAVVKFAVTAIVQPVGIVVIAEIILAWRDAPVTRIVYETSRASVGLGGSRLRSGECGRGQPNGGSQQDRFGGKLAAGHRSLLWGFAPQFKLIPEWDLGGICGAASSQAAPRYWQKFLPGS
jgi:hypothetical protein